jgi:glutaminyl-peptide cyclotransferase
MNNLKKYFSFLCLGLLISSCGEGTKTNDNTVIVIDKPVVQAPAFNQDSAYAFIEKQVSFGPRIPNTPAQLTCAAYLVNSLKGFNTKVIEQDFQVKAYDGKMLRSKNIIAAINPAATKRILLAAHWDTRPWSDEDHKSPDKTFDGANDGASGVGILMEIARTINNAEKKPAVGIDIILFDSEDYGKSEYQDSYCLGAQYWANNKHVANYSAYYGILLDMAGAKNAKFSKEGTSMEYAPSIVNKVWDQGAALGFNQYFIPQNTSGITDDHLYVNKIGKIPMIDIIEYNTGSGFGDYWHTQNDNMQVIDKNTLKAVGQTLLQVLYNE